MKLLPPSDDEDVAFGEIVAEALDEALTDDFDPVVEEILGPSYSDIQIEIDELRDTHREIARLLLLGWKKKEIATHLGVSEIMVITITKAPIFQEHMRRLHSERDKSALEIVKAQDTEVQRLSIRAFAIMNEIMNRKPVSEKDMRLQFDAAKDILDRAGVKRAQQIDLNVNNAQARAAQELEDIYAILQREAKTVTIASPEEVGQ